MTLSKAIARAWTDAEYRQRLLSDPHSALAEAEIEIPAGAKVKVVEDDTATRHVVLPVAPDNASELSKEELERIAAGFGNTGDGNIG